MTEREKEILGFIVKGYTNKEIAAELHVSKDTIKAHIAAMMRKVSAKNRAHLVYLTMKDQVV